MRPGQKYIILDQWSHNRIKWIEETCTKPKFKWRKDILRKLSYPQGVYLRNEDALAYKFKFDK
jgi:hypothetical protein